MTGGYATYYKAQHDFKVASNNYYAAYQQSLVDSINKKYFFKYVNSEIFNNKAVD